MASEVRPGDTLRVWDDLTLAIYAAKEVDGMTVLHGMNPEGQSVTVGYPQNREVTVAR